MDPRHILTLFGLTCDLVGAILLSIPMVWNTHAAAHWIVHFLRRLRYFLYGDIGSRYRPPLVVRPLHMHQLEALYFLEMVRSRIMAAGLLFGFVFMFIALRLIEVVLIRTHNPVGPLSSEKVLYQLLTVCGVVASLAILMYSLVRAPVTLARSLIWVARGNHERRIGRIGLVFLCLGFLLQAWVNIL